MTEENRRRNALEALSRADVCLREARALYDASLPYGAASRAYYAVFHAARALLFSAGLEATTHKGTVVLLGGSRGRAAGALRLQFHVDDSPQNCVDVLTDSSAKPLPLVPVDKSTESRIE